MRFGIKSIAITFLLSAIAVTGGANPRDPRDPRGPRPPDRDRGRVERFVLDLYDRPFEGRDSWLYLDDYLARAYPRIDFRRYDLVNLRMMAKSRFGNGLATLDVGRGEVDRRGVPGRPEEYDRPGGYYPVDLDNYRREWGNAWTVRFDGDIKVDRVDVLLELNVGSPPPPPPPPPPTGGQHLCGHRPDPFVTDTITCQANGAYGYALRIEVSKAEVDIQYVDVVYSDGSRERLDQIRGKYLPGDVPTAYLQRGAVANVTVGATSPNVIAKSKLEVYLVQ